MAMVASDSMIRRRAAALLVCGMITSFAIGCGDGPPRDSKPAGPTAADALANLRDLYTQASQGKVSLPKNLAEFTALEPFFPVAGLFVLGGQIDCDWGAGLKASATSSKHRLAFESGAAQSGGWVLFQDGSIREVKADEFQSLLKAIP
jgi:hypothetical protein